ncbi:redoxin domain-containing protein [Paraflavisolibacter sp. H34]|uniref:TlpA family protein disulfide reductase n=1 Tax=Huijunlia imazamoxiresistens TaxID=3127457 RepID=UPI003017AFB9
MKRLFSFLLLASLLCLSFLAQAQPRKLPPFRVLQANGKVFNASQLPMGKPIVVVYFSPDCDHCQVLMRDFFKRAEDFKKASVALITFQPAAMLQKFVDDYHVSRYPNIIAGTEGTSFFVRNYYNIQQMPFVALHDPNGNLLASWQREVPLKELVKRLQQLK